jgi:excisionase family DNA binding protein
VYTQGIILKHEMSAARFGNTNRLTWTVEEAAHELGIGRSSCYAACRSGEIPVLRVGRRLLIPRTALDALLASAGSLANATESRQRSCSASDATEPVGTDL